MLRLLVLIVSLLPVACKNGSGKEPDSAAKPPNDRSAADDRAPDGPAPEPQLEQAFPDLPQLAAPAGLVAPPDGTNRLFVNELAGRIRVFENRREVSQAPVFLDITDRVVVGGEMGLLGVAFHPEYQSNGFFYVNYTSTTDGPRRTIIARYEVSADPSRADKASERVLLTYEQPFSNHNGGQIAFGPDGLLYIGAGDGGSAGDPQENAQNPSTLLGTILRIDVDGQSGNKPYGIPSDNPFAQGGAGAPEVYAWGLRNPWRFSFDPATGRLWCGDVGQNAWEEIDIIENGKNYGWDVMEGKHCFEPQTNCDRTGLTLPIWEYPHGQGSASVTGGYVYRGQRNPELVGAYIYGDFLTGEIWALRYDGQGEPNNRRLLDTELQIPSFGIDRDGELYMVHIGGTIHRFVPTSRP